MINSVITLGNLIIIYRLMHFKVQTYGIVDRFAAVWMQMGD